MTALGSRLLSTRARKRKARAAQKRLVNAKTCIILHAARSREINLRRSNASANVDGLTRHVTHIDAALGRKR